MLSVYGRNNCDDCTWSIPVGRFHECLTCVICFHSRTAAIENRHFIFLKVGLHHKRIRRYLFLKGVNRERHPTWRMACCWIVSSHFDYSSQNAKKTVLTSSSVDRYCLDGCNVRSEIICSIIQHVQQPSHAETLWGLGHSIVLALCGTFTTLISLRQRMPCCQESLRWNQSLLYSTADHSALMGQLISRQQVGGWLHRAHIPRVRWGRW